MINIGLEQQQRIVGPTGAILWSGAQLVATSYIAKNSDVTAAPDILMGEGVIWDPSAGYASAFPGSLGYIPRQETTAAGGTASADLPHTLNLCVRRSLASASDTPYLGVSLEPIGRSSAGASGTIVAATTFKQGLIAGVGSLVTVKCKVTAIALGALVGAGVAAVGEVEANATAGCILGACFKINTTGVTGTGLTNFVGILVSPR